MDLSKRPGRAALTEKRKEEEKQRERKKGVQPEAVRFGFGASRGRRAAFFGITIV